MTRAYRPPRAPYTETMELEIKHSSVEKLRKEAVRHGTSINHEFNRAVSKRKAEMAQDGRTPALPKFSQLAVDLSKELRKKQQPLIPPLVMPVVEALPGYNTKFREKYLAMMQKAPRGASPKLVADLEHATKFVLTPPFMHLVDTLINKSPLQLLRLCDTARMPFASCWVEFATGYFGDHNDAGALIHRGDNDEYSQALFAIRHKGPGAEGLPCLMPYGLSFDFAVPIDLPAFSHLNVDFSPLKDDPDRWKMAQQISEELRISAVLGEEYCERWKRNEHFLSLVDLATPTLGGPAGIFLQVIFENIQSEFTFDSESAKSYFLACQKARCLGSPWFRRFIAIFALMATHVGGGAPFTTFETRRTASRFIHGKFLPPYEYRVLSLERPMTAPRVMRRMLIASRPAQPSGPTRWHEVIGAWHHRRAPVSICSEHPRSCSRAVWSPVLNDDGEAVGADQQACDICLRKRWFERAHSRGDRTVGVLEKGYEIRAS